MPPFEMKLDVTAARGRVLSGFTQDAGCFMHNSAVGRGGVFDRMA